jgi:hypothetical protein
MSDNHYESKKRWNAANYKQLNLSVQPELSTAFRTACEKNGISMRKVFTEFMSAYAAAPLVQKKQKDTAYSERRHRRKAVKSIISQLAAIRDVEEQYKENIPENLRNSSRFSDAEHAVESLDSALELLSEAFY